MRRLCHLAPVAAQVIPRNVVGDKEDEIGLLGLGEEIQANDREENDDAFHI